MRSTSNMIILAVAVVMGTVAAFMARAWLQGQTHTASTGTIVVALAALDSGAPIAEDKIAEVSWGASALPEGAFASKQEFLKDGRRIALAPVLRNEPILRSKTATADQGGLLSALLEKNMRAVTVRVDEVSGIAGFIRPGSRVDVALIRTEGGSGHASSDIILQNVKVLATDQLTGMQIDKAATIARAVTLEVTSDDAQKVLLAEKVGRLSLVLRQPGVANNVDSSRRITEKDLAGSLGPAPAQAAETTGAVRRSDNTTVTIIRGTKPEDYSVKSGPNW